MITFPQAYLEFRKPLARGLDQFRHELPQNNLGGGYSQLLRVPAANLIRAALHAVKKRLNELIELRALRGE